MGVPRRMPPARNARSVRPRRAPAGKAKAPRGRQGRASGAGGRPRLIVVGGSAGGLDSVRAVIRDLPASFPAPVVVVLHLDPKSPSNAAALLSGYTVLPVTQAVHGERLLPGHVYLAHPDRHLEVRDGHVHLGRSPRVNFSRPSVDRLFQSAAEAYGPGVLAVVLSGTGFDGRAGVQAVHAAGGSCIAEDPRSAPHPGMPLAAIGAGAIDAVLPLERIGLHLLQRARAPHVQVTASAWRRAADLMRRKCDADFQGYRAETLRRRMEARIAATGSPSAAAYVDGLQHDQAELERLRSALLVKVSSFIRDPPLWKVLQRRVLAPLAKRGKREVRIWSAGCATGEEAYTLAMLTLAQAKHPISLRVFATDVDEPSLAKARAGWYPGHVAQGLPRSLLRRYFKVDGNGRRVIPGVRRHVIFGRHDLVRDAPLSAMDVVVCRNVLIYFQPAERQIALERLASALRPGGILFLGKAEGIPIPGAGFTRLAPGVPIFRKSQESPMPAPRQAQSRRQGARSKKSAKAAAAPEGQPLFAVDANLRVTLWGPTAEAVLRVRSAKAVGTPLLSLYPEATPDLAATLRTALAKRGRTRIAGLDLPGSAGQTLQVEAIPLPDGKGLMFMGHVREASRGKSAAGHGGAGRRETQFGIDAQQALNEELQSRNEELETVNEELQSLNDEIQVQGDEARRATLFLGAMLDAGPDVVIGCDRQGRVSYWGAPAVRQFGLSADQALGKDVLRLVPRLDVPRLRGLVRKGEAWRQARKPRVVGLSGGLRVAVFPAMDGDGRMHGTLLRVMASPPPKKR